MLKTKTIYKLILKLGPEFNYLLLRIYRTRKE